MVEVVQMKRTAEEAPNGSLSFRGRKFGRKNVSELELLRRRGEINRSLRREVDYLLDLCGKTR